MNELRDRMEAITAEAKTRTKNLMACVGKTTYEPIKPEVKTLKDNKTCVMENVEGGKTILHVYIASDIRPATPTTQRYPPEGGWSVDPPVSAAVPIWESKALFKLDGKWGGGYWSTPVQFIETE